MGGCRGPITTFIVEPFIPHNEEFYLNIVSERLGNSISFSECGGIEIEENWDKVLFDMNMKSLLAIIHYIKALCNF
jgi:ATP citrate (pro-S)-lyase